LKQWGESKLDKAGYFVFTSNVDGAYEKAGFDPERIIECHGSVHWLQCSKQCTNEIWSSANLKVEVDETTFRAPEPLPKCKNCDKVARPNVLMFEDFGWISGRRAKQYSNYNKFTLNAADSNLVVIEVGAGLAVPTVRLEGESQAKKNYWQGTFIRVNLRDYEVPPKGIVIPLGGKDALTRISNELDKMK